MDQNRMKNLFNRVVNWLSGGELDRLRSTNVQVCEVATSLMREKSLDMQLIEEQKWVIRHTKDELSVLHKRIPELEQRAGCTVKYLEELEDCKFKLAQLKKVEERLHLEIKRRGLGISGVTMGLPSTCCKQSNDTTK